ncbi:uncharacterized protein LOC115883733 [Sitophilus oryzae]|nr:uncharacterized protein LOC115883733 [Sitophilus oryzae]
MYCTCKAGAGGQCKHISAFLILLTRQNLFELEDISQTQLACAWSGRKGFVHNKYKAIPVLEMPCIRSKVGLDVSSDLQKQKCIFEFFIKNLPNCAIAKHSKGRVKNLDSTVSSTKSIDLDAVGCKILNNAAQSIILMEIASVEANFISNCCATLYRSILNEDQDELFTLKQNSHEWHEARKYRITGSRCYEIYTYGGMDWEMKSKKYFCPKSFTNKYVKHGQKYEKLARECFMSKTGYDVIECGMITSPENKWLGFSPDGMVVNSEGKPVALLEIKCLFLGATMSIEECLGSSTFIINSNGKYTLKKKHQYYGQIQLGMSILNLEKCFLCLYASYDDSCVILEVENDYKFSKTMLEKIKNNYFNKMIHSICEMK